MTKITPSKRFKTSPAIIRLAVILNVPFPLSQRNVENLLRERGVEIGHRRWHLDEIFVKINGERHYLWRAVDHESEVMESFVTRTRDKKAALKFLRKAIEKHGPCARDVTDKLRSCGAATKDLGIENRRETGRWLNNRAEISHLAFR